MKYTANGDFCVFLKKKKNEQISWSSTAFIFRYIPLLHIYTNHSECLLARHKQICQHRTGGFNSLSIQERLTAAERLNNVLCTAIKFVS